MIHEEGKILQKRLMHCITMNCDIFQLSFFILNYTVVRISSLVDLSLTDVSAIALFHPVYFEYSVIFPSEGQNFYVCLSDMS